jgi:hypothetical protein
MRIAVGIVLILVGIGIVLARNRFARANMASVRELTGGRLGNARLTRFTGAWNAVIGLLFVAFGLLFLTGVFPKR